MTAELILKPKTLSLEDLPFVQSLGRVENDKLILERSPKGYTLKNPTIVPLEKILAVGQRGLAEYIIKALISQRPKLIPWALQNESIINLARYLLRSNSGSLMGFYVYANTVHQYSSRLNSTPNQIIADVNSPSDKDHGANIKKHRKFLEDCLAELQDEGCSPGRIHAYAKHVRTFYRVNEIEIPRPDLPRSTVINKDRAPKPEELQRLLDVADLREKVIISMLALGGFREGTLVRLQYRHVKEGLENAIVPLHIHVEAEITKGKYHDYDAFLPEETVEYLRIYLEARRQGNIHPEIPAEELCDDSPLIRDEMYEVPRPIGEKQLYKRVHSLYFKAGLLKKNGKRSYDLRVHSLRKFFKTQMEAGGVKSDYIEYMMGHTISTYHDIQSKGVDFLRSVYATANLRIRPKPTITQNEMIIQTIRHMLTPRQLQRVEEALSEPETKFLDPEERQRMEIQALSQALKDLIKQEILAEREFQNPDNSPTYE